MPATGGSLTTTGPPDVIIRPATLEDAPAIARVHVRGWQQAYRGQLPDTFLEALDASLERRTANWAAQIDRASQSGRRVRVAEQAGSLVGFVGFGPADGEAEDLKLGEIYAIYLDAAHWGRGIGRSLFRSATEELRGAGFNAAVLWVLETNQRARRFYELAGWKLDGQTKREVREQVVLREVRYRFTLRE
jgi:ribosomal protein S18 acetylase RimI-like enzyme